MAMFWRLGTACTRGGAPYSAAVSAHSGRDGRVAEGARLESVYTGNRIVGSNPTPSASRLFNEVRSRPKSPIIPAHWRDFSLFVVRRRLVQSTNETWVQAWVDRRGCYGVPDTQSAVTARGAQRPSGHACRRWRSLSAGDENGVGTAQQELALSLCRGRA